MLSLVLLSFAAVAAALAFALYLVRWRAREFDRLECADAQQDEQRHTSGREYAATVAMTLRRHGREIRKVFVQRGPAALVLG